MELVDLALAVRVLDFPHPLFAHDVDFSSGRGGEYMQAYSRPAKTKTTRKMISGMTIHVISIGVECDRVVERGAELPSR